MSNSSEFKKSKMVDHRTINYRFSVDSKSDPAYVELVDVIKLHNKEQAELEALGMRPHYLRVRGRGRGSYTYKGRKYDMSIPDAAADYFDVYVVRDTDAMARFEKRQASKKSATLSSKVLSAIKNVAKVGDSSGPVGVSA